MDIMNLNSVFTIMNYLPVFELKKMINRYQLGIGKI